MARTRREFCAVLALTTIALGAARADAADAPIVEFDPVTKAFSSLLPYRTSFTLDIPAPKNSLGVAVWFWQTADTAKTCAARDPSALHLSGHAQASTGDTTDKHYQVTLPALHAGEGYCISIDTVVPWPDAQDAQVVTMVTSAVVGLAAKGSLNRTTLISEVATSLGSTADAKLQNYPGQTVKSAITAALWGASKLPPLANMEQAVSDYTSAQKNVAAYLGILQKLKAAVKIPGDATDKAVTAAITQIQTAKLDEPLGASGPAAPPAGVKDAITALALQLSSDNCAKIADAKTKGECAEIGAITAANTTLFGSGASYVSALTTATNNFSNAEKDLSAALSATVSTFVVSAGTVSATADSASYTQAAPLYISGDVGVAVPLLVNTSSSYGTDVDLYVAVSVSFIAVDKDVPLAKEDSFLRRFSLLGGFTITPIKSADSTITGVLGGVGILGGAGLRLTDYVRVGGGVVFLRQNDTDRLITDTHVRVAPYFSLSIDLDVAGVVTGIFSKGTGLHI